MVIGSCIGFSALLCVIGRTYPTALLVSVTIAALAIGMLRTNQIVQLERQASLTAYLGSSVTIEGRVAKDPDVRDTSVRVLIDTSSINNDGVHVHVLALLPSFTQLQYGDTVAVSGELVQPQSFITTTGHTFDYPNYLRAQSVSAVLNRADVLHTATGSWSLPKVLYAIRHAFDTGVNKALVEPYASLLKGLLLGEKSGIPPELTESFVRTGLIHIVALSGYNVGIVADAMFRVLRVLPRVASFPLGALSMIFFALLTGAGASTVRATVMALIALVGRYFHRSVIALRVLAVAVAGMVLWNPLIVLYDPSFQLSVLATVGLITISPWIEARLPTFLHRTPQLKAIIASTLGVQLFVLPAILYYSGVLSLIALPANALVLPLIPACMGLGFLAALLVWVHPFIALPLSALAYAFLWFIVQSVLFAAQLPLASVVVAQFSPWIAVMAYIPLGWFAYSLSASSSQ